MTRTEYIDKVFEVLESFDYPNLIVSYNEMDVAHTLSSTIWTCRLEGISPIMCAIIIWSLTLNLKVIPDARKLSIH